VTGNLDTRADPWQRLAAIRAQVALVQRNAAELEQLGLTLSGRDLATVDHADLVSYVVWISQFTAQTNQVLANWGLGLIGYMESTLRAAGMTPPQDFAAAKNVPAGVPQRWWRRS
jgi:hypothetical protein